MKKNILILCCLLLTIAITAQERNDDFWLELNHKKLNTNECLTTATAYDLLIINTDTLNINKATFFLELVKQEKKVEVSLANFGSFNLKFWLLSNNAFKNKERLLFHLTTIKNNKTKTFSTSYCLAEIITEEDTRGIVKTADFVKIPVYFVTDRNYNNVKDVYEQFGTQRSKLKYGKSWVSIPNGHKVGQIESPSIWSFEFAEDTKKHVVLQYNKLYSKASFFNQLSADIKKSSKKSSFLFVHGYNVSFADAAKRTAQISYDLKFDGEPVFYSWPSTASLSGYTMDEANIQWAQTNLKNFLKDYLSKSEAEEIFLVAHSMGNRGLARAIIDVIRENPELKSKIKEIILAAPDIDADVFKRDIAPKMVTLTQKPITLYVASDDLALQASKEVHGYARAGDSGNDLIVLKGIETIDASGIDTSFLSHSYFADTSSIIDDIYDLIKSGKRAASRKRLKPISFKNKSYWKVFKK